MHNSLESSAAAKCVKHERRLIWRRVTRSRESLDIRDGNKCQHALASGADTPVVFARPQQQINGEYERYPISEYCYFDAMHKVFERFEII